MCTDALACHLQKLIRGRKEPIRWPPQRTRRCCGDTRKRGGASWWWCVDVARVKKSVNLSLEFDCWFCWEEDTASLRYWASTYHLSALPTCYNSGTFSTCWNQFWIVVGKPLSTCQFRILSDYLDFLLPFNSLRDFNKKPLACFFFPFPPLSCAATLPPPPSNLNP